MNSSKKAYLFAGLAVFFWSTVATAFKIALREYDFIQLIFYASGVTVLLLFLVLIFQQKSGSILTAPDILHQLLNLIKLPKA